MSTTATLPRHIVEAFVSRPASKPVVNDNGCIVIPDCLILGFKSTNGRRYTESCLQEAVSLYEGAPINNDHPEDAELTTGRPRKPSDVLGYFKNVRYDATTGLRGDACFTVRNHITESVKVAAVENPRLYGFSHDAYLSPTVESQGEDIVNKIIKVNGVDLVSRPATGRSMFEFERVAPMSKETTVPAVAATVPAPVKVAQRKFESLLRFPREKRICEQAGMTLDMPVDVAEGAGPEDAMKTGFLAAIKAAVDANDKDMALKVLESYFEITDGSKEKPAMERAREAPGTLGMDGGLRLLESQKVPITSARLSAVARLTEAEATAYLSDLSTLTKERDELQGKVQALTNETPVSLPRLTESERTKPADETKEGQKRYDRFLVTTSNN